MEFIESRLFTRRLHQLAGDAADELLRAIQGQLAQKPDRGALVPGLGRVRKARIGNPRRGKGKRAGFRYLYLHLERRQHVHLLILLDKNERKMPAQTSVGRCATGSQILRKDWEAEHAEENQGQHL